MIGVGASVVAVVGEVDVVNASDEPTNPQRPPPGIGFHGLMFKLGTCVELWGEHPMCAFCGYPADIQFLVLIYEIIAAWIYQKLDQEGGVGL
jgi:hypothetical protein